MTALKKALGFPMLSFYGIGMILGAGIYSIIGKAAVQTGETLWLGFILAGVSALLTAISYAELATLYPKAGGEFIYLGEAFKKRKWIASTAGAAVAFSGAATAATVALAFAGYLNNFFDFTPFYVATGVLILFTCVSIIGIKTSGWVTVISTLIEVAGLIFIIYLGMTSEKFGDALSESPHMGTLSGTALIIFSFFGFENIVNLSEEAKNPQKDISRAILFSVIFATLIYILVSLSALALLSLEKLGASNAPLMEVAATHSKNSGKILGAIALFSTANTALISLIGASRILFSMGKVEALPKIISQVALKRKTPWIASLIVLAIAFSLLPLGKLETVASISSLATLLAFLLVNVALITLRYTQGSKKRIFKVPLSVGKLPLIPVLAAFLCLVLLFQFEAKVYLIGGTLLAFSALIFKFKERFAK